MLVRLQLTKEDLKGNLYNSQDCPMSRATKKVIDLNKYRITCGNDDIKIRNKYRDTIMFRVVLNYWDKVSDAQKWGKLPVFEVEIPEQYLSKEFIAMNETVKPAETKPSFFPILCLLVDENEVKLLQGGTEIPINTTIKVLATNATKHSLEMYLLGRTFGFREAQAE